MGQLYSHENLYPPGFAQGQKKPMELSQQPGAAMGGGSIESTLSQFKQGQQVKSGGMDKLLRSGDVGGLNLNKAFHTKTVHAMPTPKPAVARKIVSRNVHTKQLKLARAELRRRQRR